MRNLCVLVLMASLTFEDYVQGRSIHNADGGEQNIFGHLYLLDSHTGHSQRLKRRHVESPQDVQRLRLELSSVNKVIDIDLLDGSVLDSTTNALIRHDEHEEQILLPAGTKCYLSGRVSTGDGYASFSFCNGVNGIIHTNNESYTVKHVTDATDNGSANDADADLPSVAVKITRSDDVKSAPIDDTVTAETPTLFDFDEAVEVDFGKIESAWTDARTATIEVGIYINQDGLIKIKNEWKINSTSEIVDWVINRWNIVRNVFRNANLTGINIDIKIKRLAIWTRNPIYFREVRLDLESQLIRLCQRTSNDGVDFKIMYTGNRTDGSYGASGRGTVCTRKQNCAVVFPQISTMQMDVSVLGQSLGLRPDHRMDNCKQPYGFMSSAELEFKDCYGPELLYALNCENLKCVFKSSNLTSEVFTFSGYKRAPADPILSNVIDKW